MMVTRKCQPPKSIIHYKFILVMFVSFDRCKDIDECMYEQDPVCSQTCSNTIGTFTCGCMTGYVLRPDLRTCKALGASPTLLFTNRAEVRQVKK